MPSTASLSAFFQVDIVALSVLCFFMEGIWKEVKQEPTNLGKSILSRKLLTTTVFFLTVLNLCKLRFLILRDLCTRLLEALFLLV